MDYQRPKEQWRFGVGGVDLKSSPDAIPPNKYSSAQNCRWYSGTSVRARPGYNPLFATGANAITDLRAYSALLTNDAPRWIARDSGNVLWLDNGVMITALAGLNGGGVSMLPFRPSASPADWMYCYAAGDQQKISAPNAANSVNHNKIGIAEPQAQLEFAPNAPQITDFTGIAANWTAAGTAASPSDASRLSTTVTAIFTDPANPARVTCQIPTGIQFQIGEDTNQGPIVDVLPAVASGLVVQAIRYKAGTSGAATIVPSQLPIGTEIPGAISAGYLRRGALIKIGSTEVVLVLDVVDGPNGLVSFDVVTSGTYAVGAALAGVPAVIIYGATASTLTATQIDTTVNTGVGTLSQALSTSPFAEQLGSSGIFPQEDDYVHLSALISNPAQILELKIIFNADPTVNYQNNVFYYSVNASVLAPVATGEMTQLAAIQSGSTIDVINAGLQQQINSLFGQLGNNLGNAETFTSLQQQIANLQAQQNSVLQGIFPAGSSAAGSSQWTEILFPISALTRIGNNQAASLANVNGVQIYLNVESVTATWTSSTFFPLGYEIVDPSGHIQQVTTAGVSGTTTPTWNDSGGTTSDGSVVWQDEGTNSQVVTMDISSLWVGNGGQPDVGTAGADYRYRAVARASATGVQSNPSPDPRYGVRPRRQNVTVKTSLLASPDPQMDTWDVYRYGGSITSFRYLGSVPFGSDFTDQYFDDAAQGGKALDVTNFEPWPSVDVPFSQTGGVTVTGQYVVLTGMTLPVPLTITRWLPGTLVTLAGGQTYTLRTRPTMLAANSYLFELTEAAGYGAVATFTVQEPLVANQPQQSVWGPDQSGVVFGVGDQLRPGTVSWCTPNTPDSVPATNNLDLCPGSEPLLGGAVITGKSLVGSSRRWWQLYPNFQSPGQYTAIEAPVGRALITRWGHVSDGATVYFWTRDGIWSFGARSGSLTEDLFPLFPHEGVQGKNITRNGVTYYAPDYSRSYAFRLGLSNTYLFATYQDSTGTYRTLTLDLKTGAWVSDKYANPVSRIWGLEGQPGTLNPSSPAVYAPMVLGDANGKVWQSADNTSDNGAGIQVTCYTFEWDGGDLRAQQQYGDAYVDVEPFVPITVQPMSVGTPLGNITVVPSAASRQFVPVALVPIEGQVNAEFLGLQLSWLETYAGGNVTTAHIWQLSIIPQPEISTSRVGDWENGGSDGAKWFQGCLIHADTFNQPKTITIEDENGVLHPLQPAQVQHNGEEIKSYSFPVPFISHLVRDVPDLVPWKRWSVEYISQPTPEEGTSWITQRTAHQLKGYQTIYRIEAAYEALTPVTLAIIAFDGTSPATITLPANGGIYTKVLITPTFNKGMIFQYSATSTGPFRFFLQDFHIWIGVWGGTELVDFHNLGGALGDGAAV